MAVRQANGTSIKGISDRLRVEFPLYSKYYVPRKIPPSSTLTSNIDSYAAHTGNYHARGTNSVSLLPAGGTVQYNRYHEPEMYHQAKALALSQPGGNQASYPSATLPQRPLFLNPTPVNQPSIAAYGTTKAVRESGLQPAAELNPGQATIKESPEGLESYQAKPPSDDAISDNNGARSRGIGPKLPAGDSVIHVRLPQSPPRQIVDDVIKTEPDSEKRACAEAAPDITSTGGSVKKNEGYTTPNSVADGPSSLASDPEDIDLGTVIRRKPKQTRDRLPSAWAGNDFPSADMQASAKDITTNNPQVCSTSGIGGGKATQLNLPRKRKYRKTNSVSSVFSAATSTTKSSTPSPTTSRVLDVVGAPNQDEQDGGESKKKKSLRRIHSKNGSVESSSTPKTVNASRLPKINCRTRLKLPPRLRKLAKLEARIQELIFRRLRTSPRIVILFRLRRTAATPTMGRPASMTIRIRPRRSKRIGPTLEVRCKLQRTATTTSPLRLEKPSHASFGLRTSLLLPAVPK